jgi:hypothetical protein
MDLRKREFDLFLPDVDDRRDKAGPAGALGRRSLSSRARAVLSLELRRLRWQPICRRLTCVGIAEQRPQT